MGSFFSKIGKESPLEDSSKIELPLSRSDDKYETIVGKRMLETDKENNKIELC